MYVPCTPHTPGHAIGAAVLAYHDDPQPRRNRCSTVQTPYLGSTILSGELPDRILGTGLYELQVCNGGACTHAARLVSRGLILAWIQGRGEFAPQSLGNRSIIADPRRAELRGRLQSLSPKLEDTPLPRLSVLHEYGPDCFDHFQVSPYMERTLQPRLKVVRRVPGVSSRDSVVKINTVKRDRNEHFYELIFCFYRLGGIPMIVNLDCGFRGRRFVKTAEDILSVLSTRGVDAIFVDDLMVWRKHLDIAVDQHSPVLNRQEREAMQ